MCTQKDAYIGLRDCVCITYELALTALYRLQERKFTKINISVKHCLNNKLSALEENKSVKICVSNNWINSHFYSDYQTEGVVGRRRVGK